MARKFASRPEFYTKDLDKAASINIKPASLTTPTGDNEPAIAIFSNTQIIAVLPTSDAYRIATIRKATP